MIMFLYVKEKAANIVFRKIKNRIQTLIGVTSVAKVMISKNMSLYL